MQSTKSFEKIKGVIKEALSKVKSVVKDAIKIIPKKSYRERYQQVLAEILLSVRNVGIRWRSGKYGIPDMG